MDHLVLHCAGARTPGVSFNSKERCFRFEFVVVLNMTLQGSYGYVPRSAWWGNGRAVPPGWQLNRRELRFRRRCDPPY